MSNPTASLIELRRHYERIVVQSEYQVAEAKVQLEHIDALLVDGLVQKHETPVVAVEMSPLEHSALATALETAFAPSASSTPLSSDLLYSPEIGSEQTTPQPESLQGGRTPRQLQSAYEGLTRFEAITQALQATAGQEMTTDRLITELFGKLSASEQKSERKRLNTLLYNGAKQGLWQKGTAPSSYQISKTSATKTASKPTAEPTTSTAETSAPEQSSPTTRAGQLQLLPAFEGMSKLAAISKVLIDQAGQVLHQDRIIELLYGELSPEVLKAETKRLRASLFQGASRGLWDKAPRQLSSYLVKASKSRKAKPTEASESAAPELPETPSTEAETSSAKLERKQSKPKTEKAAVSQPKQASRGREQVLSLPTEFEGLSKIEAVSKVLADQSGTVMHIEDIIERFYGELPKAELKAEKDRMKDVMTRGVKRGLWSRASGIPSSFVVNG